MYFQCYFLVKIITGTYGRKHFNLESLEARRLSREVLGGFEGLWGAVRRLGAEQTV